MNAFPWILAALIGSAGAVSTQVAGEAVGWPQWAGPARDGSSPVSGVFGGGTVRLREVWRRPVGWGFAGLTVAGKQLFSLESVAGNDAAFAVDADTGKELWRTALGPTLGAMKFGAASTPATDGRRVFVLGSGCKLQALEAASGKLAWQHDLKAEYKLSADGANGCWTSPLLADNRLIVQVSAAPDKRVVAFDPATGAVVWSAAGVSGGSRTSPALADLAGVRQVVVHDVVLSGQGGLYGLRLKDGALLWSIRFTDAESFSNDMPIVLPGDRVAAVTWSGLRAVAIHRAGERLTADLLWSTRDVKAEVQPVTLHGVAHEGYIYGFGSELLVCIEVATGKTVWKEKIYPGSLIVVDGHLVTVSQTAGFVRVIEATPAGYREKARLEVFTPGALADTPPSFAGRRIYLRNSEQMVAVEVVAGGGP